MLLGTKILGQLGSQVIQVQDNGKRLELLSPDKHEQEEEIQLHEQEEEAQLLLEKPKVHNYKNTKGS